MTADRERRTAGSRLRIGAVGAAMAVAAVSMIAVFGSAGRSDTVASTELDGRPIEIQCVGRDITIEECGAWGASVLEPEPPVRTFELADLSRLRIEPISATDCRLSYFISRYPEDPVATATRPCPASP